MRFDTLLAVLFTAPAAFISASFSEVKGPKRNVESTIEISPDGEINMNYAAPWTFVTWGRSSEEVSALEYDEMLEACGTDYAFAIYNIRVVEPYKKPQCDTLKKAMKGCFEGSTVERVKDWVCGSDDSDGNGYIAHFRMSAAPTEPKCVWSALHETFSDTRDGKIKVDGFTCADPRLHDDRFICSHYQDDEHHHYDIQLGPTVKTPFNFLDASALSRQLKRSCPGGTVGSLYASTNSGVELDPGAWYLRFDMARDNHACVISALNKALPDIRKELGGFNCSRSSRP